MIKHFVVIYSIVGYFELTACWKPCSGILNNLFCGINNKQRLMKQSSYEWESEWRCHFNIVIVLFLPLWAQFLCQLLAECQVLFCLLMQCHACQIPALAATRPERDRKRAQGRNEINIQNLKLFNPIFNLKVYSRGQGWERK